MADLPAVTGDDRCVVLGKTFAIVSRPITNKDTVNSLNNIAAELFSTENIEPQERTKDHLDFERRGFSNNDAINANVVLGAARGDKVDIKYFHERTIGKVEERSISTNLNVSLVEFLQREELNDATSLELQEAGIIIDAEAIEQEEDYTKNM